MTIPITSRCQRLNEVRVMSLSNYICLQTKHGLYFFIMGESVTRNLNPTSLVIFSIAPQMGSNSALTFRIKLDRQKVTKIITT